MKRLLLLFFIILFSVPAFADDIKLESIGVLCGQNLYLSYTTVGLLFDNFTSGVYEADFSMHLSKNLISSLKKSKNSIQYLIEGNTLEGDDLTQAKEIINGFDAIITECNSFMSVVENNNSGTIQQFQSYKTKAWSKIEVLLKANE